MSIFKAKAPFFSAGYYKEILRELRIFGIIFIVFQFLHGLFGAFGLSFAAGPFSLLDLSNYGIRMNPSHADSFLLYFFICAVNFCSTHIWRKNWDFRNNLPIAKRTMFVCHFAAVLTYAVLMFIANYIGAFVGEVLRAIINTSSVPDGFGMSAVSMLSSCMDGISIYCAMIILGSITNRVLSGIAAIGTVIGLPVLFVALISVLRQSGMNTWSLLFPIGIKSAQFLLTLISIVGMLLLIAAAYFAFGKSRVETFQKPARTKWIHILIGLGVASCVGLFAACFCGAAADARYSFDKAIYETHYFYLLTLVYGGIAMFIAYFVFMWITMRSFTGALKRCVYVPLAFLVIGAAVLCASTADKKWRSIDFSPENIESIRIMEYNFTGGIDFQGAVFLPSYSYPFNGYYSRGTSRCFDVVIKDEKLIKKASAIANDNLGNSDYRLGGLFSVLINGLYSSKPIEITLKDGRKYAVSPTYNESITLSDVNSCESFINEFASIDRFKNGKVLDPAGLGSEFAETLIDELDSMDAFDRAMLLAVGFDPGYIYENEIETDFGRTGIYVTFSSPTYDHVRRIEITDQMPKTLELYMKLLSERTRSHKDYGIFIDKLKNAEFSSFSCDDPLRSGTMEYHADVYIYRGDSFVTDDWQYVPEVKQLCALIAKVIEENKPLDSSDEVIGFEFSGFQLMSDSDRAFSSNRLFGSKKMRIFVGVSSEDGKKLQDLFSKVSEMFRPPYVEHYYRFEKEASIIADAIEDGSLKVYDSRHNELATAEEFMDSFFNGNEYFYDEDENWLHITELYSRVIDMQEDNL